MSRPLAPIAAFAARAGSVAWLRAVTALGLAGSAAAAALLALCPSYTLGLLIAALVATELCAWTAAFGVAALALCAWPSPLRRWRPVTGALAVLAIALALPRMLAVSEAARTADAALATFDLAAPATQAAPHLRAAPVLWSECFLGLAIPPSRPVQELAIPGGDGAPLPGLLYRPLTAAPAPLVVMVHGGGWHGGGPQECPDSARYLAGHGIAVAALSYRLAPAARFPAALDDVRAALRWLRAQAGPLGLDGGRIALLGRSAGGQLVLLASTSPEGAGLRAVVACYPAVDLLDGFHDPPHPDPINGAQVMIDYLGGTPEQLPAVYRNASPMFAARAAMPPVLLLHGVRDHVIQIGYLRRYRDVLLAQGGAAALIEVPWAEHGFDQVEQGLGGQFALDCITRFLAGRLE